MNQKAKIKATTPWMLIIKDIRLLEHDAASQYKFNRSCAIIWALAMGALLIPLWPHNLQMFVQLLILEVSLWANFATHFGAMSAALAAKNTTRVIGDTSDIVEDMSDDINDIHAVTEQVQQVL